MFEYLFVLCTPKASGIHQVSSVNGEAVLEQPRIWEYANRLGRNGWELISKEETTYVFKRYTERP